METKYVRPDGSLVDGGAIRPDHYVTTVAVTFRSLGPVDEAVLQDCLRRRYEVIGTTKTHTVCVVRP